MTSKNSENLSLEENHVMVAEARNGNSGLHGMQYFYLDQNFINGFIGKQPNWGPLGYITYKRTYARFKPDGTTEEFWETARRVVEGCYTIQKTHCLSLELPWIEEKAQRSAQKMYEKMWHFKFLPPGRGLWTMGTKHVYEHGSMSLNNCGFVSTERLDLTKSKPFEFMMDASMLGVGVGFDTKGAGSIVIKAPADGTHKFSVPDTREGWVEGLKRVIMPFFDKTQLPEFDFSLVRPKGLPIKGFGGVSSGPDPLDSMYKSISSLLLSRVGKVIRSIDIVDIMNFIGKCVISGNVRRTAQIALGDPSDIDFMEMKDPEKYSEELSDRRWASNNSIVVDPNKGEDYSFVSGSIAKNGEPGIIWLENSKRYSRMGEEPDWKDKKVCGVNPCGEQSLECWELCCLVETFPSRHESYEEFRDTLKVAYLYAKSVTLMRTHWKETNAVMLKNRRIGTSVSGIMDAIAKHGRRKFMDWLKKGYQYLKKVDDIYSDWLCIPKSVKITTVKPSGTTSLLAGVSPGIHYPHSEYYIRRIRVAKNSDLIKPLLDAGYLVEPVVIGEKDTMVVEFPIKTENYIRGKNDVSMEMQVMNAIDLQKYWSDNQVSITVTFSKSEAGRIRDVLEFCEDKLKGISFLPINDHGYAQAPYEEISKQRYDETILKIKPIIWKSLEAGVGVRGCDGEQCNL